MEQKLIAVVAAALGVPTSGLELETTADEVEAWDSMGHIHLMVALEDTFDIRLEVEDFSKLTSVTAMLDYLKSHGIE